MIKFSLLLLLSSVIVNILVNCYQSPRKHVTKFKDQNTVYTKSGEILGTTDFETRHGKKIYAFRGIRYAKSPTGDRRFKAPEPVDPWHGEVLNATTEGPACPLPTVVTRFETSEDCLRLNVYSTKIPTEIERPSKPVMVFFHPGGFYSSSGISSIFGPQYLLDMDIVLVTFNYRLGTLGFLSTGDEIAPGNNGLKDQVIALRWIRDNIDAFGGDPNKVTIFGYSAGSRSVILHMVSPMSKGLFHRVIAMSASPTGTFEYATDQFDYAQKQARLVDCPDTNSAEIVACLKTKNAQDIASTFFGFNEVGNDPTLRWRPVIEVPHSGERFLVEDPTISIKEGRYHKVPLMTGVNEFEFANLAYQVAANETLLKFWDENFDYTAPIAFYYERNTTRSKEISTQVRKFYFGNSPIDKTHVDQFGKLYADALIGFPVNRVANLIAQTNDYPVFYYQFAYKGMYSFFYLPESNRPLGPVHHDELMYLFYMSQRFPLFGLNDPANRTVERMTKLWSNFAKFGNPTPTKDPITDRKIWEPLTPKNKKYMKIKCQLDMERDMFRDRYALWDKLFPLSK